MKKNKYDRRLDDLIYLIKEMEVKKLSPEQKGMIIWREVVERVLEEKKEEYTKLGFADKRNPQ